jgi:Bacterial toxin 44
MPSGAWDYKTQGTSDGEAQGNFHYGSTGTIYLSPTSLFMGGGAVRLITYHGLPGDGPYLDDSNDHRNIQDGIDAGC